MNASVYAIPGIAVPMEQIICDVFGINRNVLFQKTRLRPIVEARQFYFYLKVKERDYTGYSEISRESGFNHSTVIYSVRSVETLLMTDKNFQRKAKAAINKLKPISNEETRISPN